MLSRIVGGAINRSGAVLIEQAILNWLDTYGQTTYLLIPVLAFLEACLGVGLMVSGAFLLVVATATFTRELVAIEVIVAMAFLGAVLGDQLGFYVGRWVGPGFHHTGIARRYRANLQRAELFIRKYGAMAVFIGRFIPAIRSVVPAMLGLSGFSPLRYLLLDVLACLLWSVALGAIVVGLDLGFGLSQ